MKKILSPMEKLNFPESEELPEGVREIEAEDTFGYCTELYPDVEYAEHSGKKLHLQIMTPTVFGQDLKWPLIVYVQGSSWHKQKLFQSLPTLVRMCERGYAIAIVEHRESELAPFPAQVIDVKTAIRFLRLNGQRYHIDTDKISLWGDSSGAPQCFDLQELQVIQSIFRRNILKSVQKSIALSTGLDQRILWQQYSIPQSLIMIPVPVRQAF